MSECGKRMSFLLHQTDISLESVIYLQLNEKGYSKGLQHIVESEPLVLLRRVVIQVKTTIACVL